jgi:hypothetical protein
MHVLLINPPVLTVDAYQVYSYADVIPYGLYQIATHLQHEGHQVRVIDMMDYLEGGYQGVISPGRRFAVKPGGDAGTRDCPLEVYRYGRDPRWLGERLAEGPAPDEVLVTCCLAFNWEPAHQVIRQCREAFPRARIRFGGFYPTLFPEHAKKSGADEVFEGRWEAADRARTNLDLCENLPRNWLFRLVAGCKYRCSFCINSATEPQVICEPEAAAAEIRRLNSAYGIKEFSNWDPNVLLMPDVLAAFLEDISRAGPPVELRFDMGIPPHLLTRELAARMREAGTVAMTIPFESADPEMLRRFGKPYRLDDSRRALEIAEQCGFDISRFHCTFILGVRGEDLGAVFRTYFAILQSGGKPTPFPLTPTPGTREYDKHRQYLEDKDLDLLNGHLWPTQGPADQVRLYQQVLRVVSTLDLDAAREEAQGLPEEVREVFEREAARFGRETSPAVAGAPLFDPPGWLHARCQGCAELAVCSSREDRREPDPARCYQEQRGVDLDGLAALFSDLRRCADLEEPRRYARHEERMWRHLAGLQKTYANTFEPSLAWDGRRWHCYRYTYSFCDDAPDRWQEDAAELLAWLDLLDERLKPHAEALLKICAPPLVRGLLFGIDARSQGQVRYKIYFRFNPGMHSAKGKLLAALAGEGWSAGLDQASRLFIICFDLGPRGVSATKYYFLHETMDSESFLESFPKDSFYPVFARDKKITEWEEVILIARQISDRRELEPELVDANAHCLRNDIRIGDVRRILAGTPDSPDLSEVLGLFSRHPLYLSSITFPLQGGSKVNLYYRLAGQVAP